MHENKKINKIKMSEMPIFKILLLIFLLKYAVGSSKLNTRIIIIGGGISGLAAGNELIAYGFKNITILEAQDRLGGRIHTVPLGKKLFER